jgi:hypothetical protein
MRSGVWVTAWIFCWCGLHQLLDTGEAGIVDVVLALAAVAAGFGLVGGEAGGQKQSASRDYMTKHDLPHEQRILILPDKFRSAKNRSEHARRSSRPATEPCALFAVVVKMRLHGSSLA